MTRTPTPTLITALRILAADIQSGDGVANTEIAEAADRLEEMASANNCPARNGACIRGKATHIEKEVMGDA